MNKAQLKKSLKSDIYCRLQRSKVHGIGVVAIRDIPKGTNPFLGCKDYEEIVFTKKEVDEFHPEVKRMIYDFFPVDGDTVYIPDFGLNNLDISFFLNHSDKPNVVVNEVGEFFTKKAIKAGEELRVDYKTLAEK